ncbi:MAG: ABC transporter permease [Anaerobutyricum sp.]
MAADVDCPDESDSCRSTCLQILSILKVDIGLCLIGVVIGEFLAAKEGLGYLIIYGSQVFKMDWVMLSIVLLCLIAALLYGITQSTWKTLYELLSCRRQWDAAEKNSSRIEDINEP